MSLTVIYCGFGNSYTNGFNDLRVGEKIISLLKRYWENTKFNNED